MLILVALGAVVVLVTLGAFRFARMDETRERAAFAARRRRQVVFEGALTPRAARELIPERLLKDHAGSRVRVTVEPAEGPPPPPDPAT